MNLPMFASLILSLQMATLTARAQNTESSVEVSARNPAAFETIYSEQPAEYLNGLKIRRTLLRNDSLYILATDQDRSPYLFLTDIRSPENVLQINTDNTKGSEYPLADIALTSDGVLCGCSMSDTQFNPEKSFRIYKWHNYTQPPIQWFASQESGNFNQAHSGGSMIIQGDSRNCRIITPAINTDPGKRICMLIYEIRGEQPVNIIRNYDPDYTVDAWGEDFSIHPSPFDPQNIIINGSAMQPAEYSISAQSNRPMILVSRYDNPQAGNQGNTLHSTTNDPDTWITLPNVDSDRILSGIDIFTSDNGLDQLNRLPTSGIEIGEDTVTYASAMLQTSTNEMHLFILKESKNTSISLFRSDQSLTTGILRTNANMLFFYPNPATGIIFLEHTSAALVTEIFDMKGSLQLKQQGNRIDISGLKQGVYLIRNDSGQGFLIKE